MDYTIIAEYRPQYINGSCHLQSMVASAKRMFTGEVKVDPFYAPAGTFDDPEVEAMFTFFGDEPVPWDEGIVPKDGRYTAGRERPFVRAEITMKGVDLNLEKVRELMDKAADALVKSPVKAADVQMNVIPMNGSRLPTRPKEYKPITPTVTA